MDLGEVGRKLVSLWYRCGVVGAAVARAGAGGGWEDVSVVEVQR